MLYPLVIIALVLSGVGYLVWMAELQTTVSFVLDKGGIWLCYSSGIGKLRLTGYQARLMLGHKPRAWKFRPIARKMKPVPFEWAYKSTTSKKWKPIQVPLRSIYDIGVTAVIRELKVRAKIGIEGDAVATALLCGGIAVALQTLRAAGTRGEFVPRGFIAVQPVFSHARLSVRFQCILAIKARHIIRETLKSMARRNNDGKPSH